MRLILLFVFFPFLIQAQQIQQLTKNNYWDAGIDMYQGKVVWQSGDISVFDKQSAEIFLAEGNKIQQITNNGSFNFGPKIGGKYVVWAQWIKNKYGVNDRNALMCYDGKKIFCLDSSIGNLYHNTVNKYVLWLDDSPNSDRVLLFDGEKTVEFTDADGKPAYGGYMTEAGIFYTFWSNSINYLALYNNEEKHEIIDSSENQIDYRGNLENGYAGNLIGYGSKENGKSIFYSLCDSSYTDCSSFFLINGVKHAVAKISDSLKSAQNYITYYGNDFLVFNYMDINGTRENLKIIVWRNGKFFEVSGFPFENVAQYPELTDITFPFRYSELPNRLKTGIFHKGKIYKVSEGDYSHEAIANNYGVAWVSSETSLNMKQTSEVYYFCANDSCITAKPTENFSLKIFHRDNAKQIAIEVETPQAENFVATVYDLIGRELVRAKFSGLYGKNIYTIPSDYFTQGMYIVNLQNTSKPEQHLTQKLFIPN
ncbi:MAG: T9SS type A sorting domain-containing protein [Sphingobacteriales bacterium]|nr:MAG: T9SS type A sorting domain-containing protein [Sphingobacteriales bacterium]